MVSVNQFISNPKKVFLLDAAGALLTTLSLSVVLVQLRSYFGMPIDTLYLLSGVAFLFFIYSLSCHFLCKENWRSFLVGIIVLNTLYGTLSIAMLVIHSAILTTADYVYFVIELIAIGFIIFLECKTYAFQQANHHS
jgi:hypothetical protein